MKKYLPFLFLLFFSACQQKESVPAAPDQPATSGAGDLSTFTQTKVEGSNLVRAQRKDAQGNIIEEGLLKQGKREGTWISYYKAPTHPKIIASYIDDKFNGPYMEFNETQGILLQAYYENNLLHGPWARYQYGELAFEATYNRGKLDGIYREYRSNGQLSKEISYKDGELDGPYRFFDEAGKVLLEYEYKNGKKIR